MKEKFPFDQLDLQILRHLLKDARTAFTDIAKKLVVSSGTIHLRVEKMKEAGVIVGSKITIDPEALGLGVTTLLGINLTTAKKNKEVIQKLNLMDEVVEAYYTTGSYALIIKVVTRDIDHLHKFLVSKLQMIDEIQSTESFICLDRPIMRDINPVTLAK